MRWTFALALALVAPLTGCVDTADADHTRQVWTVDGTFTENATQDDIDAVDNLVTDRDGRLLVMESFPLQYAADLLDEVSCQAAADDLGNLTYVATVGECHVRTVSWDPDAPVSNG